MVDRFGKPIIIGWHPHEFLWLEAALSLPRREQAAAFRDISALTGREVDHVRKQANRVLAKKNAQAKPARVLMVPEKYIPNPKLLGPFQLAAISKDRLMAGRASIARSRPI